MKMVKVYYRDEFLGRVDEVYSTKEYTPDVAKGIAYKLEIMGATDIRLEAA